MKRVSVIGEGAWGTAIATLLAYNGNKVVLWCYHESVKKEIEDQRINNRYLPGVLLSPLIKPTTDLAEAIQCDWIFEAIPVKFLRSILDRVKEIQTQEKKWVVLSKGIEQDSSLLPSQIIDQVLGYSATRAIIAGPSFARDLAQKEITGVDCVTTPDYAEELSLLLANDFFKLNFSSDALGVQAAAALKNVIAILMGIVERLGYGDNTKSFIFTRALHELSLIVKAIGGKPETVYGLSGVGDLLLTSYGKESRNRNLGIELAQGKTVQTILDETGSIPEGLNTAKSVYQLMQKHALLLPIYLNVYQMLYENKSINQMIDDIFWQGSVR